VNVAGGEAGAVVSANATVEESVSPASRLANDETRNLPNDIMDDLEARRGGRGARCRPGGKL
jgi:hypothetical protein